MCTGTKTDLRGQSTKWGMDSHIILSELPLQIEMSDSEWLHLSKAVICISCFSWTGEETMTTEKALQGNFLFINQLVDWLKQ